MRSTPALSAIAFLLVTSAFAGATDPVAFEATDDSCTVESAAVDCRMRVTAALSAWCETGDICFVAAEGRVEVTDAAPARPVFVILSLGGSTGSDPCHAAGAPTTTCDFDTFLGVVLEPGACLPVSLRVEYGVGNAFQQASVEGSFEACRALDGTLTLE